MQFKHIREGVFRVFAGNENACMLSRYGIVKDGAESRLCHRRQARSFCVFPHCGRRFRNPDPSGKQRAPLRIGRQRQR